tara:strand:+ start:3284 stop:3907 length:624 start_codon:yes stop_codon:yes gene_type:complete
MKDVYWAETESQPTNTTAQANSDSSSESNDVVEAVNNRIYFYSAVTRTKVLQLNKALTNLNINLVNRANSLQLKTLGEVHLHINSYGGSVFAGLAAVDYVRSSEVPVHTVVEGCVASAATLFSVVGHHRQIRQNSCMLIHQLSSGMWGKYEEMKDAMENNTLLMRLIKDIYQEHTKLPKKKINEIMKRDLWLDAETCLEYGLVDEIV